MKLSLIAPCGMNCGICYAYLREKDKQLDKRYQTKYNMSEIENLEYIKKNGIRKFVSNEKIRWVCSNCGGTICVHKGYCHSCGNKK